MKVAIGFILGGACTLLFAGCNSYTPPDRKADLQAITDPSIKEGFAAKPEAGFPAAIALVRVQAPDYQNYWLRQNGGSYGTGQYSIVTAHEVEDESQLNQVRALPQVDGIISLNRMLVPPHLVSDKPLRVAAAKLQADMVFLYTFDTRFVNSDSAVPISVISLGIAPTKKISAVTTASALLMDTRTGYVYASFENTQKEETRTDAWQSQYTADRERQANEKKAFGILVNDFVAAWPKLCQRYAAHS